MSDDVSRGARSDDRREVVLAGSGGQGLVFLGRLLGRAAARRGLRVVQTQSYGVASRGGFSKSEVIVAERAIAYPMATRPWGVLALTDTARALYAGSGDPDRLVVFDTYDSDAPEGEGERGYPFTRTARERGLEESFNLIALGAFLALRPVVAPEAVEEILEESGGERGRANRDAFLLGVQMAQDGLRTGEEE